jgi:hypothetical protein
VQGYAAKTVFEVFSTLWFASIWNFSWSWSKLHFYPFMFTLWKK